MLPAIAASGNGRLVALASRSRERGLAMLQAYRDAELCDSYSAVLDRRDVDAVYIPLVNSLHSEWTLRALDAGKHVLCEKPLAMDAAEAELMAAAARASGLHLMEAFMYRFDPEVRRFTESVRDPLHVDAVFGFRLEDAQNYRLDPALGGGALLDVGCYTVSAARWILGEPSAVYARAHVANGVDMTVAALLEFAGGRTASLWASFEAPEAQELRVIARDGLHRRERPFTPATDPLRAYRLMVESFADSVVLDRPVEVSLEETIANMRVLDRIRAAFSPGPAA